MVSQKHEHLVYAGMNVIETHVVVVQSHEESGGQSSLFGEIQKATHIVDFIFQTNQSLYK